MCEPKTIKERMEDLGWIITADFDCDGVALHPQAMKVRDRVAVAYLGEWEWQRDLAACRDAYNAEWAAKDAA